MMPAAAAASAAPEGRCPPWPACARLHPAQSQSPNFPPFCGPNTGPLLPPLAFSRPNLAPARPAADAPPPVVLQLPLQQPPPRPLSTAWMPRRKLQISTRGEEHDRRGGTSVAWWKPQQSQPRPPHPPYTVLRPEGSDVHACTCERGGGVLSTVDQLLPVPVWLQATNLASPSPHHPPTLYPHTHPLPPPPPHLLPVPVRLLSAAPASRATTGLPIRRHSRGRLGLPPCGVRYRVW